MSELATIEVLVVDDDITDFVLVRDMLKRASLAKFNVVHAAVTKEADSLVRSGKFDCVLLDYSLPEESGLQLLEKWTGEGITTPIIMFTGYKDQSVQSKALALGASNYVTKNPMSAEALERTVLLSVRNGGGSPSPTQPSETAIDMALVDRFIALSQASTKHNMEVKTALDGIRETLSEHAKSQSTHETEELKVVTGLTTEIRRLADAQEASNKRWYHDWFAFVRESPNITLVGALIAILLVILAVLVSQTLNTDTVNQLKSGKTTTTETIYVPVTKKPSKGGTP